MSKVIERARGAYKWLIKAASSLQSPFLLAVRLYWGWQFFQTGWGKLQDISKPIDYFTQLGIPFPTFNAYFIGYTECVGGILLFIGLASRLISIPLVIDMCVAYIIADKEALKSIFSDPGKFYAADPYTFWFAALLVLIFGPGKISVDYLIAKFVGDRSINEADARRSMVSV